MVIVWGQRMYGRIDKLAGSYIATRFFHLYYVPLIPLQSWLVLEDHGGGSFRGVELPMQGRSVLAAWLRVFGTMWFVASVIAFATTMSASGSAGLAVGLASLLLASAIAGFAWFMLGRLSPLERAARSAYYEHTGRFVDPALVEGDRGVIKTRAIENLDQHLGRHATSTYREAPQSHWKEIAARPDMRDVPLLTAALTRCRIELVEAKGSARAELAKVHAQILANLVAAKPELLKEHTA